MKQASPQFPDPEELNKLLAESPEEAVRLLKKLSRQTTQMLNKAIEAKRRKLTPRSRPIGRLAKEIEEIAQNHLTTPDAILKLVEARLAAPPEPRKKRKTRAASEAKQGEREAETT